MQHRTPSIGDDDHADRHSKWILASLKSDPSRLGSGERDWKNEAAKKMAAARQ